MLRTKIYNDRIEWKNKHQNKALMVLGARQVCKTHIIKQFAQVLCIKREILDNYINNIVKYALNSNAAKIRVCFLSIPNQLVVMLEDGSQLEILRGNLGINKGAIYENVVAYKLHKNDKKLFFFEYNSTLEIDFFIRYLDITTQEVVKSANNTKSKFLNCSIMNCGVKQGLKLSSKNIEIKDNNVTSLPLCMAMFL